MKIEDFRKITPELNIAAAYMGGVSAVIQNVGHVHRGNQVFTDVVKWLLAAGEPISALDILRNGRPPILMRSKVLNELEAKIESSIKHADSFEEHKKFYAGFCNHHGPLKDHNLMRGQRYHIAFGCLDKLQPKTILELGCGEGTFDEVLLGLDSKPRITIADMYDVSAVVDALNESCGETRVDQHIVSTGLTDWPQKKFDCVLLMEIIEHVNHQNQMALIKAAWERVADGGLLIISTPDGSHYVEHHETNSIGEKQIQHLSSNTQDTLVQRVRSLGITNTQQTVSLEQHLVMACKK